MRLEEAKKWIKKFDEWFKWNRAILERKDHDTQRVLLENFLNEKMLSKMKTDTTVADEIPIRGANGLLEKLATYYINDEPMIICRQTFTLCKQDRRKSFKTWWERKMKKGQECALETMKPDNWLQLELLQGVNDPGL